MNVEHELTQRLATEKAVRFALLFGSRSRGLARPGSDWDVAVYLDEKLTPRERFELRLRLLADLSDLGTIDLVVLNDAPPLLAHRALMGRQLKVRDKVAYVRFAVRTMQESEDERHHREIYTRAMLGRLQEGSFGRP